jgi:dTDP-glucose 4,6-dehydratase
VNWSESRVVVTGAGGFIGSHLTEQLVGRGAKVRAFVRYNAMSSEGWIGTMSPLVRRSIEVVSGDIRDAEAVRRLVRDADVVFHLAALISIPYSYLSPGDVVVTNVTGTLNVLNACREFRVGRVIHTSTSEVYGTAVYVPIDEKHPLQGQSPYSASKIGADMLAESFWRSYEVPVTIVRPFNTYGPRQSARAIIPTIITQALAQDRVMLGDVHTTRDLVFVEDTAVGFIRVAETEGIDGEIVNLGTGQETSVGDLASTIGRLMGKRLETVFDATRIRPKNSEVQRLLADASRARALGWTPAVSLEAGLSRTIQWIAESAHLYRPGVYRV